MLADGDYISLSFKSTIGGAIRDRCLQLTWLPQIIRRGGFRGGDQTTQPNRLCPQIQPCRGTYKITRMPGWRLLCQDAQEVGQPLDLLTQQIGNLQRLRRRICNL